MNIHVYVCHITRNDKLSMYVVIHLCAMQRIHSRLCFYCSPFFLFLPLYLPPSFFFVFLFLRPIPPPSIHPSLSLPLSLYLSPSSLTLTPNTQLDETKQYCSLTPVGCRRAMSSLLVELLFLRGEECHDATSDLPRLFQQHFGFPLPLAHLGVDSPVALMSLTEIKNCIQVLACLGMPMYMHVL